MQLLTTHSLQLVTVQPKPGEIIVSIAGEKRQAVSRRELKRNVSGINTSFVLGLQELNGNVLYLNLGGDFGGLSQHEPHFAGCRRDRQREVRAHPVTVARHRSDQSEPPSPRSS